ncbi:acyltransferase [Aquipseudomonas campi]|uniref:Acyltransferase n=1 Tax=Aquipseudomonas campi TaxID=2731681 RepID=A0A6M8FES7_9GAMM|nr:acyltransferase [Pseudomonas campi]QKE63347.1 acyltransferase [Pseudomonas campi]
MTAILREFVGIYSRALATPLVHKGELLSVQRLRGLAVLMVLVYHVEDIAFKLPGWGQEHSIYSELVGYSAPDLFFVISGFIMSYITFTTRFEPRRWLLSRFFRIFPMYVFFTSLVLVLWLYNPAMTMGSGVHDWGSITRSLLMLPQAGLPLLFVGWTVEHELVFYATVFLVARFLPVQWLYGVMLTLSVLALGKWLLQQHAGIQFWDFHILSLYMIQFTIGALIYRFWAKAEVFGWKLPLLLCVIFLGLGMRYAEPGLLNQEHPVRVLIFGFAYGMLLLTVLNLEKSQRAAGRQWQKRDWLVWCGDASYSIYLSHPFVLALFGKLYPHLQLSGGLAGAMAILSGLTVVAVGMVIHVLLEKPVIEIGKRLSKA